MADATPDVIPPAPVVPDAEPSELPRGVEGVRQILENARTDREEDPTPDDMPADGEPDAETQQTIADQELADPELETATEGETLTLAKLAEIAGVEMDALYKVMVPMADGGDPVALGDLKDATADDTRLDAERTVFEERRREFENEMIRSKQELQHVLQLLPELPPELIAKAQADHTATLDRERAALIDVKPEWADPATFQRAQDDILEAVSDYGFTRADLDAVLDHRLTKLLHDFAGLRQRVKQANARMKEVRTQAKARTSRQRNQQRSRNPQQDALMKRAREGTTVDKTAAVRSLIQGTE